MNRQSMPAFRFWWWWLLVVTCGVIAVGAFFILSPEMARHVFSLLYYRSSIALDDFQGEAVRYITFAHGILGAVMIGWGVALLLVLLGPLRQAHAHAWRTFVVSLAIWFVVDSGFSLWSGYWQNAILNSGIALLFLPGLVGTRCTDARGSAAA